MGKSLRPVRRSIFTRERPRSSQLRAVADRRYGDARVLLNTGKTAHANGAMYLGGFVVECLLKAALIREHPWLESWEHGSGASHEQKRIRDLCFRSHALDEILDRLPNLVKRLQDTDRRHGRTTLRRLKEIAAHWTIFARYSPRPGSIAEAAEFLTGLKEIRNALHAEVSR